GRSIAQPTAFKDLALSLMRVDKPSPFSPSLCQLVKLSRARTFRRHWGWGGRVDRPRYSRLGKLENHPHARGRGSRRRFLTDRFVCPEGASDGITHEDLSRLVAAIRRAGPSPGHRPWRRSDNAISRPGFHRYLAPVPPRAPRRRP